jgi:hypothetical protein
MRLLLRDHEHAPAEQIIDGVILKALVRLDIRVLPNLIPLGVEDREARVFDDAQMIGNAEPILKMQGRIHELPGRRREPHEIDVGDRAVKARVVVDGVDRRGKQAAGAKQAAAMLDDRWEIVGRNVLHDRSRSNQVKAARRLHLQQIADMVLDADCRQVQKAVDAIGQSKSICARRARRYLVRQSPRLIQRLVNQVVMKFRVDVDQDLVAHAKRAERQSNGAVPARAELQTPRIGYRRVRVLAQRSDVAAGKFTVVQESGIGVRQGADDVALQEVVDRVPARHAGQGLLRESLGYPGTLKHRPSF